MNKREEERLRKQQEKLEKEIARTEAMSIYEKKYSDYEAVCGIDEAGRGPFAGPVAAAAVILPKDHPILYLNDSKKLSEKKREELYGVIMEQAEAVGVGIAGPERIDEINILQATYEAEEKFEGLELYYQPLAPTVGIQAQLPVLLAEYIFYSKQDVEDYLTLLSSIDRYYEQILEFEKEIDD